MAAETPQPDPAVPKPAPLSWYRRLANKVGDLAAKVITTFVLALVPLSAVLVFQLCTQSPTTVDGYVFRAGTPVANIQVELDGDEVKLTNPRGHYLFIDVSDGLHNISLLEDGKLLLSQEFALQKEHAGKNFRMDSLDIAVAVPEQAALLTPMEAAEAEQESGPTPTTSPTPTPEPPVASPTQAQDDVVTLRYAGRRDPPAIGQAPVYNVVVEVEGTLEQLTQIESVTYYLPREFQPSVVTRYTPEDAFRLEFRTSGEFWIDADVTFYDGRTQFISTYVDLP